MIISLLATALFASRNTPWQISCNHTSAICFSKKRDYTANKITVSPKYINSAWGYSISSSAN